MSCTPYRSDLMTCSNPQARRLATSHVLPILLSLLYTGLLGQALLVDGLAGSMAGIFRNVTVSGRGYLYRCQYRYTGHSIAVFVGMKHQSVIQALRTAECRVRSDHEVIAPRLRLSVCGILYVPRLRPAQCRRARLWQTCS